MPQITHGQRVEYIPSSTMTQKVGMKLTANGMNVVASTKMKNALRPRARMRAKA
jgi:hypothetical protein